MEKRQKKLIIPFIALLVLAILITGIALLVKKYMPSSKEMSLDDYFKVSKGEMQVILQDQIYDTKALYDNGEIYVDFGLVHDSLNSRFYWDAKENQLLYTTWTAAIIIRIRVSLPWIIRLLRSAEIMPMLRWIM